MNYCSGAFTLRRGHEQTFVEPCVRRINRRLESRCSAKIVLIGRHRFAVRQSLHDVRLCAAKAAIEYRYKYSVVRADEVARLHFDAPRRNDDLPVAAAGSDRSRKTRSLYLSAENWNETANPLRRIADSDGYTKFSPGSKAEFGCYTPHAEHCTAGAEEPVRRRNASVAVLKQVARRGFEKRIHWPSAIMFRWPYLIARARNPMRKYSTVEGTKLSARFEYRHP